MASRLLYSSLMLIALAILAVGCGGSSGSDQQDSHNDASVKIVNGSPVSQDELPPVVRVYIPTADGAFGSCTGTFISERHVLTAAHCFKNMPPGLAYTWSIEVDLGNGESRNAVGLAVHPSFVPNSYALSSEFADFMFLPYDIAIVQIMGDPYEGPIAPISAQGLSAGQQVLIAGFGQIGSELPDAGLRMAVTTVEAVSALDGALYWTVQPGEGNTCYGDSGGPAFVVTPQGHLALAGITSGGIPDCEAGSLSYDTLVISYLDFIDTVTGGNFELE